MSDAEYVIYKIWSPVTDWIYFGKTMRADVNARFAEHIKEVRAGRGAVKGNVMRKYGVENFQIEIVEACIFSVEESNQAERRWIAEAKAAGMRLMNSTEGGDGVDSETARRFQAEWAAANPGQAAERARKAGAAAAAWAEANPKQAAANARKAHAAAKEAWALANPKQLSENGRKGAAAKAAWATANPKLAAEAASRAARIGHETRAIKSGRLDHDGLPWLPGEGPDSILPAAETVAHAA